MCVLCTLPLDSRRWDVEQQLKILASIPGPLQQSSTRLAAVKFTSTSGLTSAQKQVSQWWLSNTPRERVSFRSKMKIFSPQGRSLVPQCPPSGTGKLLISEAPLSSTNRKPNNITGVATRDLPTPRQDFPQIQNWILVRTRRSATKMVHPQGPSIVHPQGLGNSPHVKNSAEYQESFLNLLSLIYNRGGFLSEETPSGSSDLRSSVSVICRSQCSEAVLGLMTVCVYPTQVGLRTRQDLRCGSNHKTTLTHSSFQLHLNKGISLKNSL